MAQQPAVQEPIVRPARKAAAQQPTAKSPVVPQPAQPKTEGPAKIAWVSDAPTVHTIGFPDTIDEALTQAMENNPEIVTAKAMVQLAEAELNAARLDISRKLIGLWTERRTQQNRLDAGVKQREALKAPFQEHTVSADVVDRANIAVIEAQAKCAQLSNELRYLMGQGSPAAYPSRGSESAASHGRAAAAVPPQLPKGPIVEKIREQLLKPTQLDVTAMPVSDVLMQLGDLHGITMKINENGGIPPDTPITINEKGITLAALLQAMEDQFFPEWKFVIRDYGILLTTTERAKEAGYYPAIEFARQSSGAPTTFETTGRQR
jgi:hypothetical protein